MKTINTLSIFTLLSLGCAQFDQDADYSTQCENVACTQDFRTVMVTVLDNAGVKVPLDSIAVIHLKNNENITRQLEPFEWEMAQETGSYPLFGDENVQKYRNQTLEVTFKGFISGNEVVNEKYTVGADCCHVGLVKGNTNVVIGN